MSEEPIVKRRGRPPGSKNKTPAMPKHEELVEPKIEHKGAQADYRHADPATIVSRQFKLLDWAQQAARNEMQRAFQESGKMIANVDVKKLCDLSSAIVNAINALKKVSDVAEELQSRMTPEQLLEAALKKVEGQDLATIDYAIKRLRIYRHKIQPVKTAAAVAQGAKFKAAGEDIKELLDDED